MRAHWLWVTVSAFCFPISTAMAMRAVCGKFSMRLSTRVASGVNSIV
jgi:hypothetical protein